MRFYILIIVAFLKVTIIFSQEINVKNLATDIAINEHCEDENGNIYITSRLIFLKDKYSTEFDSLQFDIFKLSKSGELLKRKKIVADGFEFYASNNLAYIWATTTIKPIWNRIDKSLEFFLSGISGDNISGYSFQLLKMTYDTNLHKIDQEVLLNQGNFKLIQAEIFKDTVLFANLFSTDDQIISMFKYNLNTKKYSLVKDDKNLITYWFHCIVPISNDIAIFAMGSDLIKVNFKTKSKTMLNDCFTCYPQLINPSRPIYSSVDSTILMIGQNIDSIKMFNAGNYSLNLNHFGIGGEKTKYKIFPTIKYPYQTIGYKHSSTNIDTFIYIASFNRDWSNADNYAFFNYFSSPSYIKLSKISFNGKLVYEKFINEDILKSPIPHGIFTLSNNRLLLVHDEWDHISHPNVFLKDLVFTILNEDGEILSTNKHRVSENHNFLVYPNPANSANPLNVVLPPGMVGQLQIQIIGLNGQVGKTFIQQVSNGQNELQLDLNSVASGAYILHVANQSGEQFSVPVVVE